MLCVLCCVCVCFFVCLCGVRDRLCGGVWRVVDCFCACGLKMNTRVCVFVWDLLCDAVCVVLCVALCLRGLGVSCVRALSVNYYVMLYGVCLLVMFVCVVFAARWCMACILFCLCLFVRVVVYSVCAMCV